MRVPRTLSLLAIAGGAVLFVADAPATISRTYAISGSAVKIDGVTTSSVKATVVDTQTAAGTTSDAVLELQPHSAGSALRGWLTATLDGHASRKAVQLLHVDPATMTAIDSEILDQPFIQEIRLPVLDAGAKDAPVWTLRLSTTSSRTTGPQGSVTAGAAQKKWVGNAFRVEVAGIDTSRIIKADPVTVRVTLLPARPVLRAPIETALRDGVRLAPAPATSTSTISNLVLTMPAGTATLTGFQQWLAGDRAPRSGAFVYLAGNFTDVICTARLEDLVVTKIVVDSATGRARADLTVGGVKLSCP